MGRDQMFKIYRAFFAGGLLAAAVPVQAAIILDDWTFNACGSSQITCPPTATALGENYEMVSLNSMIFTSIGTSVTNDTDGNNEPDNGELFRVQSGGQILSFQDGGSDVTVPLYNLTSSLPGTNPPANDVDGWALTFTFDVGGQFFNKTATSIEFVHTAPGTPAPSTGLLNFYLTNISTNNGTGVKPDVQAATGITTGELIASFEVLETAGGVFGFINGNGSDNAEFELVSAVSNIWFDKNGVDLSTKPGEILLFSAGDFDTREQGSTGPGFTFDPSGYNCGAQTAVEFCFQEDGSVNLAKVPAPASIALLGLGLLALPVLRRRQRR